MSTFKEVINYINKNEYFEPKDIILHIGITSSTIYQYINYFNGSMYLKRTNPGEYKRINHIPENLTVSELKNFNYNKTNIQKSRYWKLKQLENKG